MMMEVKRLMVEELVSKLSSVSEETRTEALCNLRRISKDDPESRPLIFDAGALPYLSEILLSPSHVLQENAAATLLNLSIFDRRPLMSTPGLLDSLSHTLRHHHLSSSPSAVQSAAATLFSLLVVDSYRPVIGSKRDIVFALVDIVRTPRSNPRSVKDAMKALFGITLCPSNRPTVIGLGAAASLFSLVVKDGRLGVLEDATAVIAQIAGCDEAEDAFRRVSGIGVLMDLLDPATGSSDRTKENAVSALLNLVQCGGEDEEVSDDLKSTESKRVLDGIKDVAENGSLKGKNKALALLKILHVDKILSNDGLTEV